MSTEADIKAYILSQAPLVAADMEALHQAILDSLPTCELWYPDGKNEDGKVVSNPNIGYGHQTMYLANGKTREFYQIGISANTSGISVYFIGLKDKLYLKQTYAKDLGKAKITGYCIQFKRLSDINLQELLYAIQDGYQQSKGN